MKNSYTLPSQHQSDSPQTAKSIILITKFSADPDMRGREGLQALIDIAILMDAIQLGGENG